MESANDGAYKKTVSLTQKKAGWTGDNAKAKIGDAELPTISDNQASVIITVSSSGSVSYN